MLDFHVYFRVNARLPCFSILTKWNNFHDFLAASLDHTAIPKWGVKEKHFLLVTNSFELTPTEKEGKTEIA